MFKLKAFCAGGFFGIIESERQPEVDDVIITKRASYVIYAVLGQDIDESFVVGIKADKPLLRERQIIYHQRDQ